MPPAPDIMSILVQRALLERPGSLLWETTIRALIRELNDYAFAGGFTEDGSINPTGPRADPALRAVEWLEAQASGSPDQFNAIAEGTWLELGLINPDALESMVTVGNLLAQGNAALQDIVRNIESTIEQTLTETIDVTTTGETQITERRDIFIDIPTPQEVLDDFHRGVMTYAENLFNSGLIDSDTRRFLMTNPNILWGPYEAAIGQLADAGENVYEAVGTDFELIPIEQIGERIGPELLQEIRSTIERIETGDLTIEELTERVQTDLLTGTTDPDQQQEIRETINEIFTQQGTTTTTEETVTNLLQLTTERIFQRPNLGVVFKLSPLDFLRERFTPQGLVTLAGTLPGREAFQRQFPGGVAPSSARRLG